MTRSAGRIVTFGEAMLRYSPEEGTRLAVADEVDMSVAGAESNVAIAAAATGADATWMSKLPDTPLGRRVTNGLHQHGIETDVVWAESGRVGTYYVEPGPEPRGTDVTYDREGSVFRGVTVDELATDRIADADAFVTSGITPALTPGLAAVVRNLLERAHTEDTTTVFDVNYRSKLWGTEAARETITSLLPAVDVLVVGEDSAERILGTAGTPGEITRTLADEWGLDTVVLTRGAAGAVAYEEETVVEQSAYDTETVDPIGTGDAFVGGFLARRLEGATVGECLQFGAATAALKRTIRGDVAIVTREEIERVIAAEDASIRR